MSKETIGDLLDKVRMIEEKPSNEIPQHILEIARKMQVSDSLDEIAKFFDTSYVQDEFAALLYWVEKYSGYKLVPNGPVKRDAQTTYEDLVKRYPSSVGVSVTPTPPNNTEVLRKILWEDGK